MRKWFSFLFLNEEHLHHAVEKLTRELCRVATAIESVSDNRAILKRLDEMEKRIMAAISQDCHSKEDAQILEGLLERSRLIVERLNRLIK